jgi:hypothetical protein
MTKKKTVGRIHKVSKVLLFIYLFVQYSTFNSALCVKKYIT